MNQDKWEAKVGITKLREKHGKDRSRARQFPNLKIESSISPVSNGFANTAFRKDPQAHLWQKGKEEKQSTLDEIERKKTRVAPAFNKGGYQYLTPETDPKFIGRK